MLKWRSTTIGDVITLQRGFDITRTTQRPGNIPVVSSGGVGSYHDTAMAKCPGVVIGRKGTLGKVFYLSSDYWPHDTTLWVKDFKGNNPRFVYYFLQTLDFLSMDVGSSNPTLNRNHVHPIPILWPSLPEQQAIAVTLAALDDKIAVNYRIVTTSDALAQAIASEILADAPTKPLHELANITMGSSPPGDTYNEIQVGIPFYQGTRDFGFRFPRRRVWCSAPVRTAQPGDTLISVRAPVGRINVAREHCCIGRGLAALSSGNATPATLFQSLSLNSAIWAPFEGEGTVFGSINKKQLSSIQLPFVVGVRGHILEERLAALDARIQLASKETEALSILRDTLLPKLMSGEIRVRDAEKAVEDVS